MAATRTARVITRGRNRALAVPASAQATPRVPAVYLPPPIRPDGPWLQPCPASSAPGLTGHQAAPALRPRGEALSDAAGPPGGGAVRFTVYPDAAHIANGLSTGYAGETQNELTNWISVQHPAVTLAPGASALDTITIKVPAGATITIEVPAGATQGEPRRPPLPSPPSPRAGQPAGSRPSSPTAGTRRHLHIEGVQLLRRAGEVRRMVLATFALAESTVIEVTGIARVSNGTRSRAAHF